MCKNYIIHFRSIKRFFANLVNYYFEKKKFYFSNNIFLAEKIQIKNKKIKTIKNYFQIKFIKNIQNFLRLLIFMII